MKEIFSGLLDQRDMDIFLLSLAESVFKGCESMLPFSLFSLRGLFDLPYLSIQSFKHGICS